MSESSLVMLYYGFDLGSLYDESTDQSLKPEWLEAGEYWERKLAVQLGWEPLPRPVRPPGIEERAVFYSSPEYQAYAANVDTANSLVASCPVQFNQYGHYDFPSYCVQIRSSVHRAPDWGSLQLPDLTVHKLWKSNLLNFMDLMRLPVPCHSSELRVLDAPDWHVCVVHG